MQATSSPIATACSSGRVHIPADPSASYDQPQVQGVLRFYVWASACVAPQLATDRAVLGFPLIRHAGRGRRHYWQPAERSLVVLRQFENLRAL